MLEAGGICLSGVLAGDAKVYERRIQAFIDSVVTD